MILTKPDTTTVDLLVLDDSYRTKELMGASSLTLKVRIPTYEEIPIGSYIDYLGERFYIFAPQDVVKNGSRDFETTLVLYNKERKLSGYMFRDYSGSLKFSITGKPEDFINLLVVNLNSRESGWYSGTVIESTEKSLSFNHNTCEEALRMIAEAFETEYYFNGAEINLCKLENGKSNPLPLSYGKNNGFVSGVKRTSDGDNPIEVVFVQGSEKNINPTTYESKELRLPLNKTLTYEGREYISDGSSVKRNAALVTGTEGSLDCSHIYPKRECTITHVITVDEEKNFYDIRDTNIPEALDYSQCRIPGEKATIVFQTGMLAGKEFEIMQSEIGLTGYDHTERKFEIVPQEIDGVTMPNETFKPDVADKFVVLNISMPAAYIKDDATKTGASWEMFTEAVKYLYEHEDQKFTFSGQLDEIWLKSNWLNVGGKLVVGQYILFSDTNFQDAGVPIRITGIKSFINRPYKYELTLNNNISGNTLVSKIGKIETNETVTESLNKDTLRFAKRGFRDARETSKALEAALLNYSGSINPVTVNTMQLLVGDESLQFVFVDDKTTPVQVTHSITYADGKISADAGIIQHKTLGLTDIRTSRPAGDYKYWELPEFESPVLDPEKLYYMYARCSATTESASFAMYDTAKSINQESGYYHLLVAIVNSEYEGDRSIAEMYGFSELLPGRMTVDKITSSNGETFIDLINNVVSGKFLFKDGLISAVIALTNDENEITAGLDGSDSNIGMWLGGDYSEAEAGTAKTILRKDGSGQLAGGNILFDENGNLTLKGVIEAMAGGKIGGLDITENSLINASIAISNSIVESISELNTPYEVTLMPAITWDDEGVREVHAYSQDLEVDFDCVLKFKVNTGSINASDHWYIYIEDANGLKVHERSGMGDLTNYYVEVNLTAGTYSIHATNMAFDINGQVVNSTIEISGFGQAAIIATGIKARTKIGNDGFYSFWAADKLIHYSEETGLTLKGLFDMPGILASGSVAYSGGTVTHTNKLGAKKSSSNAVRESVGVYTVPHTVGHSNITVFINCSLPGFTPWVSYKRTNNIEVAIKNLSNNLADCGFDYLIIGYN